MSPFTKYSKKEKRPLREYLMSPFTNIQKKGPATPGTLGLSSENLHATLDSQVPISWTFAPGGRLSYEAYKVKKNQNAECQTKEYK